MIRVFDEKQENITTGVYFMTENIEGKKRHWYIDDAKEILPWYNSENYDGPDDLDPLGAVTINGCYSFGYEFFVDLIGKLKRCKYIEKVNEFVANCYYCPSCKTLLAQHDGKRCVSIMKNEHLPLFCPNCGQELMVDGNCSDVSITKCGTER